MNTFTQTSIEEVHKQVYVTPQVCINNFNSRNSPYILLNINLVNNLFAHINHPIGITLVPIKFSISSRIKII